MVYVCRYVCLLIYYQYTAQSLLQSWRKLVLGLFKTLTQLKNPMLYKPIIFLNFREIITNFSGKHATGEYQFSARSLVSDVMR
uniref:Uncharacterized protein n=1 Tax=Pararge aegeria TaxID=116150 RepID=S4PKC5_9NEOP